MNSPIKLPPLPPIPREVIIDEDPDGGAIYGQDNDELEAWAIAYAEQAVREALASAPADERELRAAAQATCDALKNIARFTVKSLDDRDALVAARVRLRAALASAPVAGEREPWTPYLSDRADGVPGNYAIARWNPAGYREVWNLRKQAWGSFSDDVLTHEQAHGLLQKFAFSGQPQSSEAVRNAAPAKRRDYCREMLKPGGCQVHNMHCGYPKCNEAPASESEILTRKEDARSDTCLGRTPSNDGHSGGFGVDRGMRGGSLSSVAPVAGEAHPVAWRYRANGGPWELSDECPFDGGHPGPNEECEPLYAAPQASSPPKENNHEQK